jgi:hypothetical protein
MKGVVRVERKCDRIWGCVRGFGDGFEEMCVFVVYVKASAADAIANLSRLMLHRLDGNEARLYQERVICSV